MLVHSISRQPPADNQGKAHKANPAPSGLMGRQTQSERRPETANPKLAESGHSQLVI